MQVQELKNKITQGGHKNKKNGERIPDTKWTSIAPKS